MKDKITAEDMIESLGLDKKPKLFSYIVMNKFIKWLDKATVIATKIIGVLFVLYILFQIFFR